MVVVAMVVTGGLSAVADPSIGPGIEVGGNDDTAEVIGTDTSTDQSGGGSGGTKPVLTVPGPYLEYRYIPNCSANDIDGGADALCGSAVYTCPGEGEIRYRVYTLKHEADGSVKAGEDWKSEGTQCRRAGDPPEGGPVVITIADIAEEARKAAPATMVNTEPATKSYVNVPTNFYADSAALDTTIEVLGQTIGLRFQPTGYSWTFGDGSTGTGAGVKGAPVGAAGAVEHAYRRSATAEVTLARTFEVTFTAPGGVTGTLPAPGLSNTSAPTALQIGEIQSLVSGSR